MEKIVFKNEYLNIIFGGLIIIFALVSYFTSIVEDYLPLLIGVVIILLSAKRFWFSFKKTKSKYATLILVIEFILDVALAGLLIYLEDHILLFVGLVIYIRGVSYLIINYVATRKVQLAQYISNILFVTLGTYLVFSDFDKIALLVNIAILIVGAVYLQAGIRKLVAKEEKKEAIEKKEKEDNKVKKVEAKSDKKINELKAQVKESEQEKKIVTEEKKVLEKKIEKLEPIVKKEEKKETAMDYDSFTLAELKEIAKKRNMTGYSSLRKAELIEKLKEPIC